MTIRTLTGGPASAVREAAGVQGGQRIDRAMLDQEPDEPHYERLDAPRSPDREVRGVTLARSRVWSGLTALTGVVLLSGEPIALAALSLFLAGMAATALAPSTNRARLGVVSFVPAGFVVSIAWVLCWGLGLGAVGRDAWGSRPAALAGLALFAVATGAVARRRRDRIQLVGGDRTASVLAVALLGFLGWVLASQPFALWSRITSSGTDFLRHLRMIRDLQVDGALHFGQVRYPPALHAWMAWLASALGIDTAPEVLWRAVAPTCLLLLAIVLLGLVGGADRLTRVLVDQWTSPEADPRSASRLGTSAGVMTGVVFLQTAWFGVFLNLGHIMNILVGVCMVALLTLVASPRHLGPLVGCLIGASAVAVTANAWQFLIPVVGLGALPWLVAGLRAKGVRTWAVLALILGALISVSGLGIARGRETGEWTSSVTVSGLFAPDWWWGVGLALSVVAIVVALRAGECAWAIGSFSMIVGGIVLTWVLFLVTHSTWDMMLYYPVKTLWTVIIVVIPLATSAAVWMAGMLWHRSDAWRTGYRGAARAAITALVAMIVAAVLGRAASAPMHLAEMADPSSNTPNWAMAVEDAMHDFTVAKAEHEGALVFGIVPDSDFAMTHSGYVGVVDYLGMEALADVGIPWVEVSPVKRALMTRDVRSICRYLKAFPGSLRVTGPNPAAGPDLLLESGCAPDVVRRDEWVSLGIDPVWLTGTPWADQPKVVTTRLAESDR